MAFRVSGAGKQIFLDSPTERKATGSDTIMCLGWNIQNPSLKRAVKQMVWLEEEGFDIVALSEAKHSRGCAYIKDRLASLGYTVVFPKPEGGDYCTILAARGVSERVSDLRIAKLTYRVPSLECDLFGRSVLVTGAYVPGPHAHSTQAELMGAFEELISDAKIRRKFKAWLILGDMNFLEPNHVPYHPSYKGMEGFYSAFGKHGFTDLFKLMHPKETDHSWISREGIGYRFDHAFATDSILPFVSSCSYLHGVRESGLSDHSAMLLELRQ